MTLAQFESLVRASWGADTCDPADLADWHPENPSRGQCGVTALVLHDFFGGDLMLGEVLVESAKVGYHYWNRFGGRMEVDLTREQFRPDEHVSAGHAVVRPDGPPRRCREQYETLRDRVLTKLTEAALTDPA
ncbi:YunG family protein [Fodinicola feengrottensis]|uniref:Uncharacterized protein n=1 Tax=Fodinicola feengrottensis TaxID=435914 RepID=A0ABP4THV8_9ACTN|nr:hypothetical protein [Fodinicola feengrottensis]